MKIDITALMQDDFEPMMFSASVAEFGDRAGVLTWENALQESKSRLLFQEADLNEVKDYFKGFGAWSDSEIAGWSMQEANALLLQFIAGDIREIQDLGLEYYIENKGLIGQGADGRWWFTLG